MSELERMQLLLKEKAENEARLKLIPVDGSLEVKTIGGERYIYVRKRVANKNTSTYVDKFSEELFLTLQRQLMEQRGIKRKLRQLEKQLVALGYTESALSARVVLNIDYARANIKNLIYDQAVLEGISTTFPQTEEIIENGTVNGVRAGDIQKILNLKRAWELILDKDVLNSPSNYQLLSYIAGIINEGFFHFGGQIRGVPVTIGGSSYVPPLPLETDVKEQIDSLLARDVPPIDIAIDLALYCMKTQVFIDGNKRSAIIFANHFLISKGAGLLAVPQARVPEFKSLLIAYYEGTDEHSIKAFLQSEAWRKF